MPIEITELTALNPADVAANQAEITQRVQEANPTLDLKRGVIHDLLVYLHAALLTRSKADLSRYLSARSLLDIQNDPTLADAGVVDEVLSNWGIARGQGSSATGQVTIVLSTSTSVTIAAGTIFTASGNQYTANSAFTAKVEPQQINNSTDRLLTRLDDNTWAFNVDVTASVPGTAALITKNTLVVPAALPQSYVTSYAAADFIGGLNPETNEQLLARLQEGVASKTPGNRVGLNALLRSNADFARTLGSSIIGFGDPEMLRDQHSIVPLSYGGRVDWYVRTVERATAVTFTRTATLLSKDAFGHGTWQLAIGREDAPGFYDIVSILPPSSPGTVGTLSILTDTRGVDLTGGGFIPDIQTIAEGAYSRFQTSVIQFLDDKTDQSSMAPGATADYAVTVRGMPQIGDIQDYISGFDVRTYGTDVLVKAPIPCFVWLTVIISKKRTQADPDLSAIADALCTAINNIDFVGRVYASELQQAVHGLLPEGMSVVSIDMLGQMRYPDGTTHYLRDPGVLSVPTVAAMMVSPRTVQFFLDPDRVAITVNADVPVPL